MNEGIIFDLLERIRKLETYREDRERLATVSAAGDSVMIKQLARKVEELEARAEQPHGRLDALERGLAELTEIVTERKRS